MSRIQLPYGEVIDKNRETAKLDLFLPYLNDVEKPNFQTSISSFINNRHDIRNYLLATGDIGKSMKEKLNSVFTDGNCMYVKFI